MRRRFGSPRLDDEEISDVSLATFYLFDKENHGNSGSDIQLAVMRTRVRLRTRLRRLQRLRRRSAPAALEAAALEAAAAAALEAAAAAAAAAGEAAAAAAAAASAGSAAAACRGEVAHSARLERLAIALTDARRHAGFDQVRPGRRVILFAALPRRWARAACEERPSGWRTCREAPAQKQKRAGLTTEPSQPESTT